MNEELISGREREFWLEQPLLQHGHITKANEIPNPSGIPDILLENWFSFAKNFTERNGFQDVAFTEFKPQLLQKLGFMGDLSPRVIFYHNPDIEPDGCLIINPKVIPIRESGTVPRFEGCGSIDYGRVSYFATRPFYVQTSAFAWKPETGKIPDWSILSEDPYIDLSIHEIDHLDGKTILNFPRLLWDVRIPKIWKQIQKTYPAYPEEQLKQIISESGPNGVVVYDKISQKFLLVDINDMSSTPLNI